jgi:hypothetical protein
VRRVQARVEFGEERQRVACLPTLDIVARASTPAPHPSADKVPVMPGIHTANPAPRSDDDSWLNIARRRREAELTAGSDAAIPGASFNACI